MLHKNAIKKTGGVIPWHKSGDSTLLRILCIVQFLFYKIFFQKSGDFSPKCGDFEIFLEWRFVAIFDSGGGDFCLKLSGHTALRFGLWPNNNKKHRLCSVQRVDEKCFYLEILWLQNRPGGMVPLILLPMKRICFECFAFQETAAAKKNLVKMTQINSDENVQKQVFFSSDLKVIIALLTTEKGNPANYFPKLKN